MLGEGEEDDLFTPIKQLIDGCEGFVKQKLADAKQDLKREVQYIQETISQQAKSNETDKKRIQELEEKESVNLKKLKVLEERNEKLSKKVSDLERRITSKDNELEGILEVGPCRCRDMFNGFVNVGNAVLTGGYISVVSQEQPQMFSTTSDPLISTPAVDVAGSPSCADIINPKTRPGVLLADEGPELASIFQGRKSQTAATYKSISEVPEGLRKDLMAYHVEKSACAVNELLTDLQRAYVKYICAKHASLSYGEIARICYRQGVEDRIWEQNFNPSSSHPTLTGYLTQRIKNMQARRASRDKIGELVKDQKARMENN